MKILMVCLGNICRSPLAEGILKEKTKQHQLGWMIDSAGTGSWHVGELPDERAISIAQQYHIDITDQRARQFSVKDFNTFDFIYAMDESVFKTILSSCKDEVHKQKVKMIMNESHPGKNISVPDPYHDDEKGFDAVFKMLDQACEVIVEKYKKVNV